MIESQVEFTDRVNKELAELKVEIKALSDKNTAKSEVNLSDGIKKIVTQEFITNLYRNK